MSEDLDFSHVDDGIREVVKVLNKHGFKTWKSCQGGEGHCFEMPTVRFWGNEFDLLRAHRVCENYGFVPHEARRIYRTVGIPSGNDQECPTGEVWDIPFNELVFLKI